MASGRLVGQRLDCHTFLCKFWHFQMAVSQWKLAWLTPNLGILWISVSSFRLCESIVANLIIYRLVPRPSRFKTRQWNFGLNGPPSSLVSLRLKSSVTAYHQLANYLQERDLFLLPKALVKLKSRAVYHTPLSTRVVILGNKRYWSMSTLQRLTHDQIAVCFVNRPYSKCCALWKRYWISHTSNPSVCRWAWKKIPVVFIVVDSQNFKRQGIDFFQILESFYVYQSDRNILRSA